MSILDRLAARLAGLISLGRVSSTSSKSSVQVRTGGSADQARWIQPAGLRARPTNAEAILVRLDSDELVAVIVGGRAYPVALAAGDVGLFDEHGNRVLLTSSGVSLGSGAGAAVAREGDAVAAAASMSAWITSVSTALTLTPPSDFGEVDEGSSEVTAS